MPSTHLSLSYHLVFATKNREPVIHADWQGRLHEYLGGTVRGLGGVPLGAGGIEDHVHLLIGLKATHCLSDFVRELKKGSSRWVTESGLAKQFSWQAGYGSFTLAYTNQVSLQRYIATQRQHHQTVSFREEFIALLEENGAEYDPRFLDDSVPTKNAGTPCQGATFSSSLPGVARTNIAYPGIRALKPLAWGRMRTTSNLQSPTQNVIEPI